MLVQLCRCIAERQSPMSLHLPRSAAPILGINIRNGLGECPNVAAEILHCVLTFSVRMIGGLPQDLYTPLQDVLVMAIHIVNAHQHGMGPVG